MPKNCYKKLINSNGDVFCNTLKYDDICIECITKNTKDILHKFFTIEYE